MTPGSHDMINGYNGTKCLILLQPNSGKYGTKPLVTFRYLPLVDAFTVDCQRRCLSEQMKNSALLLISIICADFAYTCH